MKNVLIKNAAEDSTGLKPRIVRCPTVTLYWWFCETGKA
jgi:hypothetical protein